MCSFVNSTTLLQSTYTYYKHENKNFIVNRANTGSIYRRLSLYNSGKGFVKTFKGTFCIYKRLKTGQRRRENI